MLNSCSAKRQIKNSLTTPSYLKPSDAFFVKEEWTILNRFFLEPLVPKTVKPKSRRWLIKNMGSGVSSAAPQDVDMIFGCIDALEDRSFVSVEEALIFLESSQLEGDSGTHLKAINPVLDAAVRKYISEVQGKASHAEAREVSFLEARAVFSANRQSTSPPVSPLKMELTRTTPSPTSVMTSTSARTDPALDTRTESSLCLSVDDPASSISAEQGWGAGNEVQSIPDLESRHRGGASAAPASRRRRDVDTPSSPSGPAKVLLAGVCREYEAAEIGGGTTYTVELSLTADGKAELGTHDIGERARKVARCFGPNMNFIEGRVSSYF
jgi:hypothetical protein